MRSSRTGTATTLDWSTPTGCRAAEIRSASAEKSAGIEEVNQAISQMDQTTQQNAALVEQAAASAESLQDQAASLAQLVSVFKLGDAQPRIGMNNAPALGARKSAPARQLALAGMERAMHQGVAVEDDQGLAHGAVEPSCIALRYRSRRHGPVAASSRTVTPRAGTMAVTTRRSGCEAFLGG